MKMENILRSYLCRLNFKVYCVNGYMSIHDLLSTCIQFSSYQRHPLMQGTRMGQ